MATDARGTVEAYYAALRAGDPLAPYFAERADLVKFGITERLEGYREVVAGLREQTATTTDWTVESRTLRVTERGDAAWFSDDVYMAWTAGEDGRREYESRWSGTLLSAPGSGPEAAPDPAEADAGREPDGEGESGAGRETDAGRESPAVETPWRFVGMHVSAPH